MNSLSPSNMNSLSSTSGPAASLPAIQAPPPSTPSILSFRSPVDQTAKLPTVLTATVSVFLSVEELHNFAQTSRHNLAGSLMLARAILRPDYRNTEHPLTQLYDPKKRVDMAVPMDRAGLDYLRSLSIEGPMTISAIKQGSRTIIQVRTVINEICSIFQGNCPDHKPDIRLDSSSYKLLCDYLSAGLIKFEQVSALQHGFASGRDENLKNELIQEYLHARFLTVEEAMDLSRSELELLCMNATTSPTHPLSCASDMPRIFRLRRELLRDLQPSQLRALASQLDEQTITQLPDSFYSTHHVTKKECLSLLKAIQLAARH